ncbi:MAG: ABC transporter ATP-binding protein [Candidatus Cloacimonadaceae bacterium]|jgi:multidrug/hemolysin transport system ATP-binding protein|nr:ABC transporter ATP-binding protein [Candidatus Cloacimonadota bacterium]MDY0127964.1 ABC transporter ATP-binding protein [Candidatus Cloacimonadaceae bacterium]MCB5254976.1 ABC transporter ATP-binding protein [Candidatus Cloacimonadota bacterium]MCK9178685.1 ABC transporter ATP-binding protein [Candidatus Cloacimonadota bacterium]MCK9242770.1 ABC transporter ATP-binding protein [Candidatus Cloacimonadota bacterium]
MSKIIMVKDLKKKYGEITAVDGISFDVERGSLFAFLGPNGAGKSTTINIISTLLSKDEGEVQVAGFELGKQDKQIRESICSVFQENILDDLLSVRENLILRAGLYGRSKQQALERLAIVSELMGIKDILKRRFGKLSGGQKRRAEIARALMNDPKILILDEPTTGLDPQTRISVWDKIQKLQQESKMTVFFTTHYMEEAANADMMAIIDFGRIVACDTPHNLKARYSSDKLRLIPNDFDSLAGLMTRKGYTPVKSGEKLIIDVKNSMEAYHLLKEIEGQFTAFEVIECSMDDLFINITGHAIRDEK